VRVPNREERKAEAAQRGGGIGSYRYGEPFEEGRQPAVVIVDKHYVSREGNVCRLLIVGLERGICKLDCYITWAGGKHLDNFLEVFAPHLIDGGGELPPGALVGRRCDVLVAKDATMKGDIRPKGKWFYQPSEGGPWAPGYPKGQAPEQQAEGAQGGQAFPFGANAQGGAQGAPAQDQAAPKSGPFGS